jgi:hypothetical protein
MSEEIVKANTPKMENKPTIEAQIAYVRNDIKMLENSLTVLEDPKDIEAYQREIIMLRTVAENLISIKVAADALKRQGKRNVYVCPKDHKTVTVDSTDGVTSFIIACPVCEENGEQSEAHSSFYRVPQNLRPTHEWYKPTESDLANLKADMHAVPFASLLDHVNQGGLLFRKIQEVSNG